MTAQLISDLLGTLPQALQTYRFTAMPMNIFLTGGTGFIGSHVSMELLNRGHDITILARNPDKISAFRGMPKIKLVKGTLTDEAIIREHLQGKDACIHIGLNYKEERMWKTILDDTVPTVSMADAAVEAGVKHFIYTSSTSVNDNLYSPANRDPSAKMVLTPEYPHTPASFYGATKAACEDYLMAYSYQFPMQVNIIRPGYTFGNPVVAGAPTQADLRFVNLVKAARANEPIVLCKTDGTQFIWAGDIAKVYADLLETDFTRKIYYALSQRFTTWAELAKIIIERIGSKSEIHLTEPETEGTLVWDVQAIKDDFGLAFDPWDALMEHLDYWIETCL